MITASVIVAIVVGVVLIGLALWMSTDIDSNLTVIFATGLFGVLLIVGAAEVYDSQHHTAPSTVIVKCEVPK